MNDLTSPEIGPRYLEDFAPGQVFSLGFKDVKQDEIIAFARVYDPHPFHIDPIAAQSSFFGGLTASGWQTAVIMMQLMHQGFLSGETSLGSPGLDELKWLNPVRPGDRLMGKVEILDIRLSKSRPDIGFVHHRATLTNQDDVVVYLLRSQAMIKTRQSTKVHT